MKTRTIVLLGLLLAPFSALAQSCPPASTPNFTAAGNVFGRIASQWNSYFASKVDANGGTLCNVTFQGSVNLTFQDIVNALGYTPVNKAGDTMTGALGIGAAAQNELSVKSPATLVPGSSGTYAFSAGNSNTEDFTVGSDVTNTYIQTWLGKPLVINGQGNNVLFNPSRSATNVGIGTSNPQSIFQITAASPSITGYSRFTTSDYVDGSVGSGLIFNAGANTGNTWSSVNAFSAGNSASASLALETNGGNVGIGTTSPGSKLTLHNAGAQNMLEISMNPSGAGESHVILESGGGVVMSRYLTNATVGAFNALTQIGDTYIGFWGTGGLQDTGGLVLGPGSGSAKGMRIDGVTGNVGIGTSAPAALLSIANGANDPNNYGRALEITNANGNRQQIAFIRNGNNVISAGYNGASAVWGFGTGNTTDASFTPNFLSIDQANNRVGINTANPSQALSVQGNLVLGIGGGNLYFRDNTNASDVTALAVNNSDNVLYMYSRGAGVHWQSFGNSTLMSLTDGGSLGIGVSPSFKLDVSGDTNTSGLYRVGGSQIAAANLANGTTGSGAIVLSAGASMTGTALDATSTVPTASTGTSNTTLASTAFVHNVVNSATGAAVPTMQVLTSGTGATYTTPVGARQLQIWVKAGGGGGGGSGTSGSTAGGTGGTSTFNSINALGGTGGGSSGANGTGGPGGTGGSGTATYRRPGTPGGGSMSEIQGLPGGTGGGPGAGIGTATSGTAGVANSGGGGGGGTAAAGGTVTGGGGGGSGEEFFLIINTPASTYTYTVGAAGTAGSAGTSGSNGAPGGTGVIHVLELY